MNAVTGFLRPNLARLLAIAAIISLYSIVPPRTLSDTARAELASRFHFTRFSLPEVSGYELHTIRKVNPSLQNIAAWISSVGAAVALNDLDGDGLPNDVCSVDTRTDQVIVAPAPSTPARFAPFVLSTAPLPYDKDTVAPMGCLPGDLNEDGLMDIIVYYWGRTPVAFLQSQGQPGNDTPLSSA